MGWIAALIIAISALMEDKGPTDTRRPPPSPSPPRGGMPDYVVTPAEQYGPKWKNKRPPGLPGRARATASKLSSSAILEWALDDNPSVHWPDAYRRVIRGLAQTESSTRMGRPANRYEGSNIRAYGLFSWNSLAVREPRVRVPGGVVALPWRVVQDPVDWSVREEVANPLMTYKAIWDGIAAAGGSALAAARGVRLWHRRPVNYKRFLERASDVGWQRAWDAVGSEHASVIDRHLRGQV